MEAAIRPHRSGTVLGLGITSLVVVLASIAVASRGFDLTFFSLLACVIAVLLGSLAIVLGLRQINGANARSRRNTRTGQTLGAAAVILSLLLGTGLVICFPRDHWELHADSSITATEMYYRDVLKAEYSQGLGPNGELVKEGPYKGWSRSGKKLEQGNYHNDKRDGPWSFWNEDGSIDTQRSGVYQNDVRIGPSPADDFPVRPRPVGYTDRP
jgi:hypothetical protein